jgi:hypothetical protein
MTQSLTEAPTDAARTAVRAGDLERDRVAWNLPGQSGENARETGEADGLDWAAFSAARLPASGRHDLKAIVAYGKYKKSETVDGRSVGRGPRLEQADPLSTPTRPVDTWEDEGGASQ